ASGSRSNRFIWLQERYGRGVRMRLCRADSGMGVVDQLFLSLIGPCGPRRFFLFPRHSARADRTPARKIHPRGRGGSQRLINILPLCEPPRPAVVNIRPFLRLRFRTSIESPGEFRGCPDRTAAARRWGCVLAGGLSSASTLIPRKNCASVIGRLPLRLIAVL